MLLVFFCEINIFRVFLFPGIVEFRGLFGVIGRDDDVSLGPHSHGHLQNSQIAGALQHGVLGMGMEISSTGRTGPTTMCPKENKMLPKMGEEKTSRI